jgi:hypothetical protein
MSHYKNLLLVITITILSQKTHSKLILGNFPTFLTSRHYQLNYGKEIILNDPSKFSLQKVNPNPQKSAIILNYHFEERIILFHKNNSTRESDWFVADAANPYKILSFELKEKSSEELKNLFKNISNSRIFGLEQILEILNSISWTKELLKEFYRNCNFTQLHVSTQANSDKEFEILDLVKNNANIFDNLGSDTIFLEANLTQMVFNEYITEIYGFWEQLIIDIFIQETGNKDANIMYLSYYQNEVTDDEFKKARMASHELLEFYFKVAKYKDIVTSAIENYVQTFPNEIKSMYEEVPKFKKIYTEHILPIFKASDYPLMSIVRQTINLKEIFGKGKKYISNRLRKYKEIFYRDDNPNFNKYDDLYDEYILETFKMYNESKQRYPKLLKTILDLTSKLKKNLTKDLLIMTSLDNDKVSNLIQSRLVKFYKKKILVSPVEFKMCSIIKEFLFDHEELFVKSRLMDKLFLSKKTGTEKIFYYSELLGGPSKMDTKRQVDVIFKIEEDLHGKSNHMLLV